MILESFLPPLPALLCEYLNLVDQFIFPLMECQNFDYLSYQPLAASHLCESMSFIAAQLMIPLSHCNNLEASSIYLLDDS
jgi:hypothetical protein